MIPYGRQEITDADIESVIDVLRSDFLTQGPAVPQFEASVTSHIKVAHAVAVNSATSALHIACLALGLEQKDILWTTPITFVASANCALYCGASVDFVDIDPKTYNISIEALREKLFDAERNGKLPKILVAVHLCGQPCEMEEIHRLSKLYDFKVIEDASHAIGGKYKGEFIGNCRYSDITVFSFHPVKIITTAEGGMALTNSDYLAEKMQLLRSHGITRDSNKMTHVADGPWYYQQVELGYNYRMTDIQAALGASQMTRLDQYVSTRHTLVDQYNQAFENFPITRPWQHADGYSAYHLYVIRLNKSNIKKSHLEVFDHLRNAGIGVNLHYIPVHTQPYYQKLGFKAGDFPEAEKYYSEAISLPLYTKLSTEDQNTVIHSLKSALA